MKKTLIRLLSFSDDTIRRQGRFYGRLYGVMGVIFVIGAVVIWVTMGGVAEEMQRYSQSLVQDIESDNEITRLNKREIRRASGMLTVYGNFMVRTPTLVALLILIIGVMFIVYGVMNLKVHEILNRRE